MDIVYLNGEAGRALVEDCRENMHKTGSCKLVGFIREDALPPLIEESNTLSPLTTEHYMNRHIYVGPDDPSSPENHPVRRFLPYHRRHIQIYGQRFEKTLQQCHAMRSLKETFL